MKSLPCPRKRMICGKLLLSQRNQMTTLGEYNNVIIELHILRVVNRMRMKYICRNDGCITM